MNLFQCALCEEYWVPPKYVCDACGHTQFKQVISSGEGTVFTYTTIRVAPEQFAKEAPYHIAVIQLPEGVRVTARLIVPEGKNLEIGTPVNLVSTGDGGVLYKVA